jgi:hypothetical protein
MEFYTSIPVAKIIGDVAQNVSNVAQNVAQNVSDVAQNVGFVSKGSFHNIGPCRITIICLS